MDTNREPIDAYELCRTVYELNEVPASPSNEAVRFFREALFPASMPGQSFSQSVRLPSSLVVQEVLQSMFTIDGLENAPNELSVQVVYSAL